jgi:uncharacterized protein (DUF1778 family)
MGAAGTKNTEEPRTERMELRVRPSAKRTSQRAIPLSVLSAADLAIKASRQLLTEHERVELTGADRDAFLDLITHRSFIILPLPVGKSDLDILVAAMGGMFEDRAALLHATV